MNTGYFGKQKPDGQCLKDNDRFRVLMIKMPQYFFAY